MASTETKVKGAGTPGFLKLRANNDSVFGFDISSEGTSYHMAHQSRLRQLTCSLGRTFPSLAPVDLMVRF
jgi:hypothetical protein